MQMPLRMSGERALGLMHAMSGADPGETVPYHVGQLLFDRSGDVLLSNVANHALDLAVRGFGSLVQRITHKLWINERFTEFEYQFIAAKHPPKGTERVKPVVVEGQQDGTPYGGGRRERVISL